MYKIKKEKLEYILGYKIRPNFLSIGLDTAQRSGLSFIQTTDKEVEIGWMFIEFEKNVDKKIIYKTMVKTFENIFDTQDMAVIEQVFVGFNSAGSIELSRYGSFAIAECIKKDIPFELISAVSCRSKLGIKTEKGKSKESVANWIKEKLALELEDHDISDAICLGLLGILDKLDFKPTYKKKAKKRK